MKASITNSLLSRLKPANKPYEVRDDKLTGFLVRVNISGKLVYMCEYSRGKRITVGKVGTLTPIQARDIAKSILGDAARGIDPKNTNKKKSGITLEDFIEHEYNPWVKQHRKAATQTLAHIKRCFIKPFGKKTLSEITPILIDQWRTQRLKDGRSIETVNRDVATFKAALSKAVLWEYIDRHPLEKLKLLKVDRVAKVRFLSADEEKRLRKTLLSRDKRMKKKRQTGNQWRKEREYELYPDISSHTFADYLHPMVLLSINTGLRQGEVFSLNWKNIDLEQAILTVEGAYAKSGKTRHIPLNVEALYVLKSWREQSLSSGLVFTNQEGNAFDNVKKSWAAVLVAAEIKDFRWHDMRHHFASRLVMANVDLNTVRELLGHSDMSMTLRYAHLAPEHKANAVAKLIQFHREEFDECLVYS